MQAGEGFALVDDRTHGSVVADDVTREPQQRAQTLSMPARAAAVGVGFRLFHS